MKLFTKFPIVGFCLLFCCQIAYTQPTVEWLTSKDYDFGLLQQGNPEQTDFQFKNISSEPIFIDNVRTTCGCTVSDWSKEPIETDSTSTISVKYDAKKEGYFRKTIKVFVSGQRKAEKLYIEGEVEYLDH